MNIGDKLKDFELKDAFGNKHRLSDFRGKKTIIYFYPKDNTPFCSMQACNYAENYAFFKSKDINIIGISKDDEKSHKKFIDKYDIPFVLLCDTEKEISKYFSVLKEKSMFGKKYMGIIRSTFIVDEEGILIYENRDVKVSSDIEKIKEFLGL